MLEGGSLCHSKTGADRSANGAKAIVGLRPSLSSHVRWCERGAPVRAFDPYHFRHAMINLQYRLQKMLQRARSIDFV
jgi:hypothetical protein